jgi:Tfp pilus assembly protein PilF
MAAAMKANPASAEAKSNYGFILQKMGRHEEALDYFGDALSALNGCSATLPDR